MIRHFSAGGVVYKKQQGVVQFLLCKSSLPSIKPDLVWSLPKGWLDDASEGEPGPKTLGQQRATSDEVRQAALREVWEEGGVQAKIVERLGQTQYVYTDKDGQRVFKTIIFFLMEYEADLPEGFGFETCETSWFSLKEVLQMLKKRKGECDLVQKAAQMLS